MPNCFIKFLQRFYSVSSFKFQNIPLMEATASYYVHYPHNK